MTISPNISALLNLIVAIAGALVSAAAYLTTIFGAGTADAIVGAASIVVTILGAINTALHATSAPTAGYLASKQH